MTRRLTVYLSEDDAERVEPFKSQMNISEIARRAILAEISKIETEQGEGVPASARVVEYLRSNAKLADQVESYEQEMRGRRAVAREVGADLVARLVSEERVDFAGLAEVDSLAGSRLPVDIDGQLLEALRQVENRNRVPDDIRHAARQSFRETIRLFLAGV